MSNFHRQVLTLEPEQTVEVGCPTPHGKLGVVIHAFTGQAVLNLQAGEGGAFNDDTDVITAPGHGLQDGADIRFAPVGEGVLPTGISADATYQVVVEDADSFSLEFEESGVDLDDVGSGVIRAASPGIEANVGYEIEGSSALQGDDTARWAEKEAGTAEGFEEFVTEAVDPWVYQQARVKLTNNGEDPVTVDVAIKSFA